MTPDPRRDRWRRFSDVARRAAFATRDPRPDEDLDAVIAEVKPRLKAALEAADQELREATSLEVPQDDGGWRRLEEAARKLESDLRNPTTLRQRLDEGRRSMMPKVERLVHSRLTPVVRQEGRRLVATVDPEGLAALRKELPEWVEGWSHYVQSWLELDLQREIEVSWNRRDGGLPVGPPVLGPIAPPQILSEIAFPDVAIGRDVGGIASAVLRNARSIAYGALSMTFLFGVSRSAIPWYVYLIGFGAAVAVGLVMTQDERGADRKRLEAEARQKAEQATWEATRQWLDRMADKLAEHIRTELHGKRADVVRWWATEVRPKAEASSAELAAAKARADQARMNLPRLQDRRRTLAEAATALDAV
ncbi:MAG: hypothetical protein H6738_18470 [Alphaproteobacteria bacterium]|nr:hypothetical protein [Alphaproteobacteria bacterium]